MELPFKVDETQQYMADKTGYFVDVEAEEKYMQIGTGWIKGDGATQAEMVLWREWEHTLRVQRRTIDSITGRIEGLIQHLELTQKAASEKNSVEPA